MRYPDRRAAAGLLAGRLGDLGLASPVVVALPRGGVPIGVEVARVLGAPLEVTIARKLGAPAARSRGIGAVAEGGVVVLDEPAVGRPGLTAADIEAWRRWSARSWTAGCARTAGTAR
jgi:putative phosphoribosyl transferase